MTFIFNFRKMTILIEMTIWFEKNYYLNFYINLDHICTQLSYLLTIVHNITKNLREWSANKLWYYVILCSKGWRPIRTVDSWTCLYCTHSLPAAIVWVLLTRGASLIQPQPWVGDPTHPCPARHHHQWQNFHFQARTRAFIQDIL